MSCVNLIFLPLLFANILFNSLMVKNPLVGDIFTGGLSSVFLQAAKKMAAITTKINGDRVYFILFIMLS